MAAHSQMKVPTLTSQVEYSKEYDAALTELMSYNPDQVGAQIWAAYLADLEETYPQFANAE